MAELRPDILCVDDDVNLLEAMRRQLSKKFNVQVATSGTEALKLVQQCGGFEVVVSDMQMPHMKGTHFLAAMRARSPDTSRLMLTGYTDLDAAIAAVNEGHIFRFLCKPCSPETLSATVDAGVEQYRLRRAARELLEQTLRGSVDALGDVLALASPLAFGRARRIQRTALTLAEAAGIGNVWQLEVATLLSQLGAVTLPAEVLERWARGHTLTSGEEAMVSQFPAIAESLLGRIPRLERVREIILQAPHPYVPGRPNSVSLESRILRLSVDLDALQVQGIATSAALDFLATRTGYDLTLLTIARERLVHHDGEGDRCVVALNRLELGMVLDEDLRDEQRGMLLVARGYKVTESLLTRLKNLGGRPGLPDLVRILRQ